MGHLSTGTGRVGAQRRRLGLTVALLVACWTLGLLTAGAALAKTSTTTTLGTSANPSIYGQEVTFTATVQGAGGTPTGTVTFSDQSDGTQLGNATVNANGTAAFSTSALAAGSHTITATYNGDSLFLASTSSGLTQIVNKANTVTTLQSSTNPSVFGQTVTFSAAVSVVEPGSGTPTGTVTFFDGAAQIGSATVNASGIAAFSTSALAAGSDSITASYGGDSNFNSSTSSGLTQVVSKANTVTTLQSSTNPSVFGQIVTFSAAVSVIAPGSGTPTGTVTFFDGAAQIGSAAVNGSGIAAFSTSALAAGSDTITASYGGDSNFNTSTSSAITQTVDPATTDTTLASSANPSVVGQSVTITATVSAVAPGSGTPTGTVTFFDGATELGSEGVNGSGVATLSTAALAVGSDTITASYGGDSNFKSNTTGSLSQTVVGPPTVTVTSPTSGGIYAQGRSVQTSFSCSEGSGGPGLASCDDSNGTTTAVGGEGHLSTSILGTHTYTVTATSRDGLITTASITYTVIAPPRVAIKTAHAKVIGAVTKVTLACAGGSPDSVCAGKLSLTIRRSVLRIIRGRRKLTFNTVVIATASYRVSSGRQESIALRLEHSTLVLLEHTRNRRLPAHASATLAGGPTATQEITLQAAPRPR